MSAWTTAFLHQFLDGNPANYRALPGTMTVQPDGMVVVPTPPPGERGFKLTPGHTMHHRFDQVIDGIIGVDAQFQVDFEPEDSLSARLDLSANAISLLADVRPGVARVQLHLGGEQLATSVEPLPAGPQLHLRGRWHTHGQAHLWVNGALVQYGPGLVVGGSFSVTDLLLSGRSAGDATATPRPRVRAVTVKLLRRDDPVGYLDELLPIPAGDLLTPACARRIADMQGEAMGLIRAFMASSLMRLTRAWRAGDTHEPFSPEAVRAHDAAVAAAREFVLFLSGRDEDARDRILDRLGVFLGVLEEADPQGYADLVARLEALELTIDPECAAPIEPIAQANADRLAGVAALLEAAWQKGRSIGDGHV